MSNLTFNVHHPSYRYDVTQGAYSTNDQMSCRIPSLMPVMENAGVALASIACAVAYRKVKTMKMHLFTFIQLICLVVLWIVKSTKASLAFPFFLILMVPLRAQMNKFFSQRELRALDGDQADVDDEEPDFYAEVPLPG